MVSFPPNHGRPPRYPMSIEYTQVQGGFPRSISQPDTEALAEAFGGSEP